MMLRRNTVEPCRFSMNSNEKMERRNTVPTHRSLINYNEKVERRNAVPSRRSSVNFKEKAEVFERKVIYKIIITDQTNYETLKQDGDEETMPNNFRNCFKKERIHRNEDKNNLAKKHQLDERWKASKTHRNKSSSMSDLRDIDVAPKWPFRRPSL
jgi:hypothetical protein